MGFWASGGSAEAAGGAGFGFSFLWASGFRWFTVLHAGLAGAGADGSAGASGAGAGGACSCGRVAVSVRVPRCAMYRGAYLWLPVWRIFTTCTVLRLHGHELRYLARSDPVSTRHRHRGEALAEGNAHNCNARRSSLSLPTSWRRMRTSEANALLKSFKYLEEEEESVHYRSAGAETQADRQLTWEAFLCRLTLSTCVDGTGMRGGKCMRGWMMG
jgi:hypothetical protein